MRLGDVRETRLAAKSCVSPLWDTLGIDVRKEMCGAFGCVYIQKRTGNAVKIVSGQGAREEIEATKFLIDLRNRTGEYHPMLPNFYEVWDLGTCALTHATTQMRQEGSFAIVREDLPDVPWDHVRDEDDDEDPLWDAANALLEWEGVEWQLRRGLVGEDEAAVDIEAYQQQIDFSLAELTSHDGDLVMHMADLFRWGYDHGVSFGDPHAKNWGMRADGELVLRDIGMASSTDYPQRLTAKGPVEIRKLSGLVQLHGLFRKSRGTSR